jgi:endonuclease/exonuclease/phosphatase family metal-dependent hydrolase
MTPLLISLLVWNTHALPFIGADPKELAAHIEHLSPDLFLGQELWARKAWRAIRATEWRSWQERQGRAGLGAFGKIFITDYQERKFKYTSWSKFDFLARKGFQSFIGPGNVLFINTHLDAGSDERSQEVRCTQIAQIAHFVMKHKGPAVIAGDLNLRPEKEHRLVDKAILEYLETLHGFRVLINDGPDYVLGTSEITVINSAVLGEGSSDHAPLLVEIEVR